MDITVSVTLVGPGPQDFRVNIFQDAPEWQTVGRSLADLGAHEVLHILQSLGMPEAESEQLLEETQRAQFVTRRRRLRLTLDQQRYADQNFPPL